MTLSGEPSPWTDEDSVRPTVAGTRRRARVTPPADPPVIAPGGRLTPPATAPTSERSAVDPRVGTTFAGRYVIEAVLGEGGMGRVYRARHMRMSRRFAIKLLHGEHAAQPEMVIRFQREAEATSRLSHRNVVGVVDFGETDAAILYLVMEFVDGTTLRRLLRDGPMDGGRALALLDQLAAGLAHAHDRGLVHRDFKPDNILVEQTEDGEVARISDFGIVMSRESIGPDGERLTTAGLVLGTPHYMAPEQTMGDALGPQTDLYALGVVLYEMLAGKQPFEGPPALVAQMHVLNPVPRIADRVPGLAVDPLLEALAMRLMAKRPEHRPASAREVGQLVRLLRSHRGAAAAALRVDAAPDQDLPTAPLTAPRVTASALRAQAAAAASPVIAASPVPRPRWPLLVLAAAAFGLGGGALEVSTRQRSAPLPPIAVSPVAVRPAVPPAPVIVEIAAPPVAAPAPVAPVVPVVAEVAPPRVADPAPRQERRRRRAAKRPRPAPVAAETVEKDKPVTMRELTADYRRTAQLLDEVIARRGAGIAEPYKRRYLAIPLADALRSPALVDDTSRALESLRRDLRRALR